ncbi:DUF4317 domain-containing protein [Halobacillus litoralis]|uniref:DUF4317 domain-containing protein n=1 Tax=Halobacillus litoralis TaxID=45668 RepID=UPI001CD7D9AC|nr:DUF4317 domain-containing protein [Halobacillus litoralis]MCA0970923.1 DUF4317 domain-containing protein [Halobacillus litoralis]
MDKKDIANIRKQFKVDNDLLKISDIFNVYIMKDSTDVYHFQHQPFDLLDRDQQELFMNNFKKVLTGQLDEKLFELKFSRDVEDPAQLTLHKALLSNDNEEWMAYMLKLVERMIDDHPYEKDIVVTFITAEYRKPMKKSNPDAEESSRDSVYSNPFILCSVNQTEEPKKEIQFDYIEKEFKYNIQVDPVIDLKKPLTGFLFPTITDGAADVNHVLYSTGKANEPDPHFIEDVLNAEEAMTAETDKAVFEEVVREVVGGQINPSTLSKVYGEIHRSVEENEDDEPPKLDYKDVERVLTDSGQKVEQEQVKVAFQRFAQDDRYELKASNIVPKYNSKSIKIQTKVANISISPQDLEFVRQVNYKGKRALMIEIDEDAEIDGFKMIPEAFGQEDKEEETDE